MLVRSGVRFVPVAMWVRAAAKQEAADRCDLRCRARAIGFASEIQITF